MKYTAIVLAAGKGSRMNSSVPKQYMDLDGYPLIYHALQVFEHSCVDEIILVTGPDDTEYCRKNFLEQYHLKKVTKVVPGGAERYLSVYQGLLAAQDTDIVLIHDGARPFVTDEIIRRTIDAAKQYGSGVAAMPVKDTIKIADDQQFSVETPLRDHVWMMQTPQTFPYRNIRSAYEQIISRNIQNITDDAMAMELAFQKPVKLVTGSYRNIKVTTPEDMVIASIFMKHCKNEA